MRRLTRQGAVAVLLAGLVVLGQGCRRDEKIKLSTIVKPEDLEKFFARYAEVCKSGMTGLKKRDRSGAKAKARAKAKKKKAGEGGEKK